MALHLRPVVGFAPPNGDDDVSRNAVLCLDCPERGFVGCQVPATCLGQSGKLRFWKIGSRQLYEFGLLLRSPAGKDEVRQIEVQLHSREGFIKRLP